VPHAKIERPSIASQDDPMTRNIAFADARASAAHLWQIHLRFRNWLTEGEAADLERRTLSEPDFARELFEHLHALSNALISCAREDDAEFEARDKPFLEGAAVDDRLFASLTRFMLTSEAASMIDWMRRFDPDGEAERARGRVDAMLSGAPAALAAPTVH
jgi:hypothetical protein